MRMRVSERVQNLPISAIRKLVPFAQKARALGVTILPLNIGDPDIKTPEVMLEVLRHWQTNPIGYAPPLGLPEFILALQKYYHSLGYTFLETSEIIATIGGSEALAMAIFATCESGDELLVFEPFYSNYASIAAMVGVTVRAIPTNISDGFHLPEAEIIEAAITPKTKALLFSNPANPTGTVYTKAEIDRLVKIAKKKGIFLLSDEVYREFLFVNRPHISLLSYFQELPNQTIVLDSLSKRYSLCGARLGILVTKNTDLIAGVTRMTMSRLSAGLIDQTVGIALTHVPESYITGVQAEYRKRRDILYTGLKQIPGITVTEPEGAFYVMVSLPIADSDHFCQWLLEDFRDHNETIMLSPGAGFYQTPGKGKNEVRIAYVIEEKKLRRAIEILKKALGEYKGK